MIFSIVLMSVSVVLIGIYIFFKSKKYDIKELFLKTGISFLFLVVALVSSYSSGHFSIFNVLVILGLSLGLIGDILLDLKYVDIERTVGYTYGGFIAFGFGHILYITALIMNYSSGNILFIILSIVIDIILSIATILMEKPLKIKYGRYKIISFIYAITLFGTCMFSLFLAIENGFQILPLNLFFIASVLFTISDLVLSGTFFGENKERTVDFILNYSTYYSAQFIISFLLIFM